MRRSSYDVSLDVISYDNFYDIESGLYGGEIQTLSKVGFEYSGNRNDPRINSFFSVHTFQGDVVVDVTTSHDVISVDPYRDIELSGGYNYVLRSNLFTRPDIIKFQQPNYNTPQEYQYAGEIFYGGIKLYKYSARFDSDQTELLSHLDAVEKRGNKIVTSVDTELWFEPISGRLVNYMENSIAYEVNSQTNQIIQPWNHFRNAVSESGITRQVAKAKFVRDSLFLAYGLWSVLCVVYLYMVVRSTPRVREMMKKRKIWLDIFVLSLIPIVFFSYYYAPKEFGDVKKIAVLVWGADDVNEGLDIESFISNAEEYRNSFKDKIKVDIFPSERNRTKAIKNIDTIVQNNYDLVLVVSEPVALLAKTYISNTPVLFSNVSYPVEMDLIDSLESSRNNFVGITNMVSPADQLTFFREIQPKLRNLYIIEGMEAITRNVSQNFGVDDLGLSNVKIVTINELKENDELDPTSDALYLSCDSVFLDSVTLDAIIEYSDEQGVPVYSCQSAPIMFGATAGLVANPMNIGSIAGQYAGLILNGVTPSSLETVAPLNPIRLINGDAASGLRLQISRRIIETSNLVNTK